MIKLRVELTLIKQHIRAAAAAKEKQTVKLKQLHCKNIEGLVNNLSE